MQQHSQAPEQGEPLIHGRKNGLANGRHHPLMDHTKTIQNAYDIAHLTLNSRYCVDGILAGAHHFSDIWTRDACFASLGALKIGDHEVVKANINTFLKFRSKANQVPLRVGQKYFLLKFLFKLSGKQQARYIDDKGFSTVVDSNSLATIIFHEYVNATNDIDFANNQFDAIESIVRWNFTRDKNNDLLIEEGAYANWADSLKKKGTVLYTNVLHWKAVDCFAQICLKVNRQEEYSTYKNLADQIKEKLNHLFWDDTHYIDWIGKKRHTYYSSDGNLLAIVLGLATPAQGHLILDSLQLFGLDHGVFIKTNYPPYPLKHIYPAFLPVNMSDYHNGLNWLWLGCLDAVAKQQLNLHTQAQETIFQMAAKIVEYNGVYEVYKNGKPVNRFFYKSETSFAWSAGLFVWACNELKMV